MKKAIKISIALFLFLVVLPSLAGVTVMTLWNSIITVICGFSAISFWEGIGLFILGQILTGGVILALFMIFGAVHTIGHRHGELRRHWHDMTDDQRREFITRRRNEHFRFRNHRNAGEDADV